METIREGQVGKAIVRLLRTKDGYATTVFVNGERKFLEFGADSEDIWRRGHDAAARLNPVFVGYDGARRRFLSFFPRGFRDDDYIKQERSKKLVAKAFLDSAAPLDRARQHPGCAKAALKAYQKTEIVAAQDRIKLTSVLSGSNADNFVQAAAAFAENDWKPALAALNAILKPEGCASWSVVTYLPFLWKPETHAFLKPNMTCEFAERVGHAFADRYESALNSAVYDAFLELAEEVKAKTLDLGIEDMIDVQSFMYTAVNYTEDDRPDR
ncbi:hypothetical protein [Cucumibacter marinus]|uniref:hypothetical protein n=1 Tax=Cucumibacter marinus TaxID=1121252 RepID=UPI00048FE101|nr:hypothetical protein [Cucumibacter marinus]